MKFILIFILSASTLLVKGQTNCVYLKANKSYFQMKPHEKAYELDCSDVFMINYEKRELAVISSSCKIYEILEFTNVDIPGEENIIFKIQDRNGKSSTFAWKQVKNSQGTTDKLVLIYEDGAKSVYNASLLKIY